VGHVCNVPVALLARCKRAHEIPNASSELSFGVTDLPSNLISGWHWQAAGTDLPIRERFFGGQPVLRRREASIGIHSAMGRSSRGTHWLDDVVEFIELKTSFVVLPVPPKYLRNSEYRES